ncbi:MAG: agmatinase [Pseudomonadota bacterium]
MSYFDLPQEYSDYSTSKVAILPAGLEETTSYAKGTARAPKAIEEASAQVEFYDEVLEVETYKIGISTLPDLNFESLDHEKSLQKIQEKVAQIVKDQKLPVVIGGEHSITPAIIKAILSQHKTFTVLQIDAHADLREEYEGSKLSHASAMARVREMVPAVQVGIRNLSKPEAELVKEKQLPIFFAHQIKTNPNWIKQAIQAIKTEKVYITIDVDGFDSSILPDTGTPEPGGLDWWEVTNLIAEISKSKQIIGYDFVELKPEPGHHASDFFLAKLIYRCIGYWAKNSDIL